MPAGSSMIQHMKPLLLLLFTSALAWGDPRFAITKSTIDGGGGRSLRLLPFQFTSRFVLTGTIGQPDAAPRLASGDGRFGLEPGFWTPHEVVQLPDFPLLVMRPGAPGSIIIAWPVTANGYLLQSSPDLSPGSWTDVGTSVVDTIAEHTVTVSNLSPRAFFRLRRQ